MSRWLVGFIALLLAPGALAQQYVGYQGRCAIGNVHAVTQGVASANTFLGTYPGCTVTVYEAGTTTPAVLYADTLGTPLPNPFTASTDASFTLFAAKAAYPLDVTISSAGIATPFTFASVTPSPLDGVVTDPIGDQTIVQPAGTTFTIYGNGVVTGTFQALNGGTLNGTFGGNPTFTGTVTLPTGTPTGQQAASAAFVLGLLSNAQTSFSSAIAAAIASSAATYVPFTGGEMTGPLALSSDTPTGHQAADANYVQAQVSGAVAGAAFVPTAGGTMTGPLALSSDTPTGRQAADANYVQAQVSSAVDGAGYVPLAGGTMTGPLILSSDSPTNSQAADANYVQAQIQPLTAKVNNAVQQNGNATLSSTTLGTLSLGHLTNSVGLQSFTVPGCTFTAGTVGNNCVVQGQLAVQEPDTNWIGVCQIENAPANGNGNVVLIGLISTKTVSSFYISEVAGNTQATGGGDIGCTVTHH